MFSVSPRSADILVRSEIAVDWLRQHKHSRDWVASSFPCMSVVSHALCMLAGQ